MQTPVVRALYQTNKHIDILVFSYDMKNVSTLFVNVLEIEVADVLPREDFFEYVCFVLSSSHMQRSKLVIEVPGRRSITFSIEQSHDSVVLHFNSQVQGVYVRSEARGACLKQHVGLRIVVAGLRGNYA